jgi:hypothetical protein
MQFEMSFALILRCRNDYDVGKRTLGFVEETLQWRIYPKHVLLSHVDVRVVRRFPGWIFDGKGQVYVDIEACLIVVITGISINIGACASVGDRFTVRVGESCMVGVCTLAGFVDVSGLEIPTCTRMGVHPMVSVHPLLFSEMADDNSLKCTFYRVTGDNDCPE